MQNGMGAHFRMKYGSRRTAQKAISRNNSLLDRFSQLCHENYDYNENYTTRYILRL